MTVSSSQNDYEGRGGGKVAGDLKADKIHGHAFHPSLSLSLCFYTNTCSTTCMQATVPSRSVAPRGCMCRPCTNMRPGRSCARFACTAWARPWTVCETCRKPPSLDLLFLLLLAVLGALVPTRHMVLRPCWRPGWKYMTMLQEGQEGKRKQDRSPPPHRQIRASNGGGGDENQTPLGLC